MDIRKVKKLIEMLEESALLEIEIKEGEESIRLSRGSSAIASNIPYSQIPAQTISVAPAGPAPETYNPSVAAEPMEATDTSGHVVKSPMVGTFYASPTPEAPAFVNIGSRVEVGDNLCILEAMKLFNPIQSDHAGKIKAVYKENGDPVEYGEALFLIE